jgi:hypothetical protein
MKRCLFGWVLAAVLSFVAASPVLAQGGGASTTGTIQGRVADASGAVLPGVTVTITSPALIGGPQSQLTNDTGNYRFPAVAPGIYTARLCRLLQHHQQQRGRDHHVRHGRIVRESDQHSGAARDAARLPFRVVTDQGGAQRDEPVCRQSS